MVAVRKLITDHGIGNSEMTTEELNHIHCRVAILVKKLRNPVLNAEAGSRVHLVGRFSLPRLETSRIPLLRNRYRNPRIPGLGSPAGGLSKTMNSRTSRPSAGPSSTSCGIVGGRRKMTGLKHPLKLKHNIIYLMRGFSFLRLMPSTREMTLKWIVAIGRFVIPTNDTKSLCGSQIRVSIYQGLTCQWPGHDEGCVYTKKSSD